MNFIVASEDELGEKVFAKIALKIKSGLVCGLCGDLGAGKSALVKQIARRLGVRANVTSPTFNLCKQYLLPKPQNGARILQHIDLYRMERISKADERDISDWLADKDAISFVEWPQRFPDYRKYCDLEIRLVDLGDHKRRVEVEWI